MKKLLYKFNRFISCHNKITFIVLLIIACSLFFLPITFPISKFNSIWFWIFSPYIDAPIFQYKTFYIVILPITIPFLIHLLSVTIFGVFTFIKPNYDKMYWLGIITAICATTSFFLTIFLTFPNLLIPGISIYLLMLLSLIEILHFVTSMYFKRHPEYVPEPKKDKEPKPHIPTTEERITALEEELTALKETKKDK